MAIAKQIKQNQLLNFLQKSCVTWFCQLVSAYFVTDYSDHDGDNNDDTGGSEMMADVPLQKTVAKIEK